ncbi:MAG: type II toxin-antitoxin system HicA family toxin [Chromatiales bacterium]
MRPRKHPGCDLPVSPGPRGARFAFDYRDPTSRGSCIVPSAPTVLSGREVVRVFESLGWQVARQSGNHIVMVKEGEMATLSVPDHREVAKGTL